ncbi:hypothetical protein EXW51_29800 (plasmid) [Bacillus mycoides]|nr:hypothetical protein EXW51_29800 [Bacillus mycoides]
MKFLFRACKRPLNAFSAANTYMDCLVQTKLLIGVTIHAHQLKSVPNIVYFYIAKGKKYYSSKKRRLTPTDIHLPHKISVSYLHIFEE